MTSDVQVRVTGAGGHLLSECSACGPVGVDVFDNTSDAAARIAARHIEAVHRPTGARI